jgi:hypothetical protein
VRDDPTVFLLRADEELVEIRAHQLEAPILEVRALRAEFGIERLLSPRKQVALIGSPSASFSTSLSTGGQLSRLPSTMMSTRCR